MPQPQAFDKESSKSNASSDLSSDGVESTQRGSSNDESVISSSEDSSKEIDLNPEETKNLEAACKGLALLEMNDSGRSHSDGPHHPQKPKTRLLGQGHATSEKSGSERSYLSKKHNHKSGRSHTKKPKFEWLSSNKIYKPARSKTDGNESKRISDEPQEQQPRTPQKHTEKTARHRRSPQVSAGNGVSLQDSKGGFWMRKR